MKLSDLQPGDRVTFRGEPYFVDTHLGDGMNSILQWADDPKYTACVPSALEVVDGKIDDRRYGAGESKGPGANATSRRDTYGGDQLSRRGAYGLEHSPARRTAHEPTPGVLLERSGAWRLDSFEVIDTPRQIEDVMDLGFLEFMALISAVGGLGWMLGDFPTEQWMLAFAGALVFGGIGYRKRRD